MMLQHWKLSGLLLTVFYFTTTDSIRCFECRSDIQLSCGDPFYPGSVPATECSQTHTNPTFMCFKASQYVSGTYVTVRGCAPFDGQTFPTGMQRSMVGTYWKTGGYNSFSLCDYDTCNGGPIGKSFSPMMLLFVSILLATRNFL